MFRFWSASPKNASSDKNTSSPVVFTEEDASIETNPPFQVGFAEKNASREKNSWFDILLPALFATMWPLQVQLVRLMASAATTSLTPGQCLR